MCGVGRAVLHLWGGLDPPGPKDSWQDVLLGRWWCVRTSVTLWHCSTWGTISKAGVFCYHLSVTFPGVWVSWPEVYKPLIVFWESRVFLFMSDRLQLKARIPSATLVKKPLGVSMELKAGNANIHRRDRRPGHHSGLLTLSADPEALTLIRAHFPTLCFSCLLRKWKSLCASRVFRTILCDSVFIHPLAGCACCQGLWTALRAHGWTRHRPCLPGARHWAHRPGWPPGG